MQLVFGYPFYELFIVLFGVKNTFVGIDVMTTVQRFPFHVIDKLHKIIDLLPK